MIKNEKYIKLFKIMKDGGPGSGRKPEGGSKKEYEPHPRVRKNNYPEIDKERGALDLSRYGNKGLHNFPNLLEGMTNLLEYDELCGPDGEEDWIAADFKNEVNLDRLSNKVKSMYGALKDYIKKYGIYDDGDTSPDIVFGDATNESFNDAIEDIYSHKYNRSNVPSRRSLVGLRANSKYKPKEAKYKGQTGWTSAGYINPDGSVPSNGANW